MGARGGRMRTWDEFVDHVVTAPGQLDTDIRAAVLEAASGGDDAGVPEALVGFIDTVARHAYRTTGGDVDRLKASGYTEDQIFEAIVVAATGAAARRLDAAGRAMRKT